MIDLSRGFFHSLSDPARRSHEVKSYSDIFWYSFQNIDIFLFSNQALRLLNRKSSSPCGDFFWELSLLPILNCQVFWNQSRQYHTLVCRWCSAAILSDLACNNLSSMGLSKILFRSSLIWEFESFFNSTHQICSSDQIADTSLTLMENCSSIGLTSIPVSLKKFHRCRIRSFWILFGSSPWKCFLRFWSGSFLSTCSPLLHPENISKDLNNLS